MKDILGEKENGIGDENVEEGSSGVGMFVYVIVLEIYNEEIYDFLLCEKGGGLFYFWFKGSVFKVNFNYNFVFIIKRKILFWFCFVIKSFFYKEFCFGWFYVVNE